MTPWFAKTYRDALPVRATGDGVEWCERNVRLPGSARGVNFDISQTPWSREPLWRATSGGARSVTYVKPVQSGGSAAGEAAICYWIRNETGGDIQYNWENNDKALARWDKRFERILLATPAVMERAPSMKKQDGKWKRGQVIFPHLNFTMQGTWDEDNLASDTIRFQVNEEIHGWEPGRLAQAYNRTTAVWNAVHFNISNASKKGDQLHQKFEEGTQQHWEVLCPGCGQHHEMRTKWDDKEPALGGLRYDADGCRLPGGMYDYLKLAETIRYQMPCGYLVQDDPVTRRAMSLGGRYGEPKNKGAAAGCYSYTLDAVAVDYIPWLTLVQEKHTAIRAMQGGDPEPYMRYVTERECRFWDSTDRPISNRIIVNFNLKKSRDGLVDRIVRFGALDRQAGKLRKGEFSHWWGVIRDVNHRGDSLLVWEGKIETDEEAGSIMKQHNVRPASVVVDSGHDAMHVYKFCLRYGFHAIKGRPEPGFSHEDGTRRIFSPRRPLHKELGAPPTKPNKHDEPQFWSYSKSGIRVRLHWLRNAEAIKWDVPGDVSEEYKEQIDSEELQERRLPKTNELVEEWVQIKEANHMYVCECYIAMLMDMAGLIGVAVAA